MAYRIEFKPSAERALGKLPREVQKRVGEKIELLAGEPRPLGVEKLSGEEDMYRVRVGEYRVIYVVRDDMLLVLVVRIGHRREVYRSRF